MKKILSIKQTIEISKRLKKQGKSIVVTGGFFDILHLGHIQFLEKSKKYADILFVLLEEDRKAKEKGNRRPMHSQKIRAKILSALASVDYVVMLKNMKNNACYDKIIVQMQPDTIAITSGDPYVNHKKRQAKLVEAKVVYAIKKIADHSTTEYIKLINKN